MTVILSGSKQDIKAFTIAPRLAIVDGLEGLVELKYEFSSSNAFITPGSQPVTTLRLGPGRSALSTEELRNNRLSLALEMTYRF